MKAIKPMIAAFLGIAIVMHLQSCYDPNADPPCPDTKYETRNLSSGEMSKVPYTGLDTLYFLNKQGDTCIVRGTGKKFGYEVSYQKGNPACPPDYQYNNQLYTIQFISMKGNLSFELTQKRNPGRIYIDRGGSYSVKFDFRSSAIDVQQNYLDSLVINGVKHNKITVFLSEVKGYTEVYDTTYKLLYNKSNGILFIQSQKENEQFSIIPKP